MIMIIQRLKDTRVGKKIVTVKTTKFLVFCVADITKLRDHNA